MVIVLLWVKQEEEEHMIVGSGDKNGEAHKDRADCGYQRGVETG